MVMPMTEPWADEVILGELTSCPDCGESVADDCQDCADEWRRRDLRWERRRRKAAA